MELGGCVWWLEVGGAEAGGEVGEHEYAED
jgi:hypothetical protein